MQIAQTVDRYKKEIFFGFLGVVLLFALLLLWQMWRSKTEAKAKASFIALTEKAYLAKESRDFDQCKDIYETLYKDSADEEFFKALALYGLAQCEELKGNFKGASDLYLRISKEISLKDAEIAKELKSMLEEKILWLALQKS